MIKKPIVNILHIGEKRKNNMEENKTIEKRMIYSRICHIFVNFSD